MVNNGKLCWKKNHVVSKIPSFWRYISALIRFFSTVYLRMKRLPLKTTALSSVAEETHQAETGLNMYWHVQYTCAIHHEGNSEKAWIIGIQVRWAEGTYISVITNNFFKILFLNFLPLFICAFNPFSRHELLRSSKDNFCVQVNKPVVNFALFIKSIISCLN